MALRTGCLRSVLVTCLTLQVAAYLSERGVNRPARAAVNLQEGGSKATEGSTSPPECVLPMETKKRIKSYQQVVDDIIDYVTTGSFKGVAYSTLAEMIDTFGPRMVSSKCHTTVWYGVLTSRRVCVTLGPACRGQ